MNDKVTVEVFGRRLTIEMEGLSQLEVNALAQMVDERMREVAASSKIVDSSKLAILTALDIAAELQRMKSRMEDFDRVEESKVDRMLLALEKALEGAPTEPK